jgi:hypothetical protein
MNKTTTTFPTKHEWYMTRGNLINAHYDGLGFSGRRTLVNSKTGQPN